MESIIVYPKSKMQKSLLKSLLEEMKIRFEIENLNDKTDLTKKEFFDKIDKSIAQAENGTAILISKEDQKELLGL